MLFGFSGNLFLRTLTFNYDFVVEIPPNCVFIFQTTCHFASASSLEILHDDHKTDNITQKPIR